MRPSSAGLYRRERASLTPPTGTVGGAETYRNSWCEEKKSNLKHDTCGAGENVEKQEGWVEEQNGGGDNTCNSDSESHSNLWSRVEARETCSHDGNKVGWEMEVEAEQQGGWGAGRWPALHAWGRAAIGVEARSEWA